MGLLLCNVGNSETTPVESDARAKQALIINSLKKEEVTNEWLKGKTATDLTNLGFQKKTITTTNDLVQYHLYRIFFYDPYLDESLPKEAFSTGYVAPENDMVNVVCFIDIDSTKCILP